MRLTWAQPEDLLPHELVQSTAEGKRTDDISARWQGAGGTLTPEVSGAAAKRAPESLRLLARELLDELDTREGDSEMATREPSDWEHIAALLPTPAPVSGDIELARSRVQDAWTGRAAGCLLGKPVEKTPRQGIQELLQSVGRWPLDRYFTARGVPDDVLRRWPWNRRSAPTSLEENIAGMPEDDDLNYPLLALTLLEEHGTDFTTDDVAQLWLSHLPAGRVFTAERAAYRNLLDAYDPPQTATVHNPFREWIGALIRGDVFGWTHPLHPRSAVKLAWIDARLTHTRNGIYGEMWSAALASAALTAADPAAALDAAQLHLPPRSRLAQAIDSGRRIGITYRETRDLDAALDSLHERFGSLHWVHTLNNAAVIACALEAGAGEFGESVSLAVMAGWDTDSVGATVGGVVGAISGVPEKWSGPVDGRIATSLPGRNEHHIADLAARTQALMEK